MAMHRVAKWGVKSVGGLVANLLLLTLWVDGIGIPPALAIPINWVLISIAGYMVSDQWVFADLHDGDSTLREHAQRYVSMQSVMAAGKLVNYGLYILLLPVVDYRVAWVIGAVVVFAVTFNGNEAVWRRLATDSRVG